VPLVVFHEPSSGTASTVFHLKKNKQKAFSAAYVEAICQPLETGISHNILPCLTSFFITLILEANRGLYEMGIIFHKLPLPGSEFD